MVTLRLYRFLQANEQLWDHSDRLEDYGKVGLYPFLQASEQLWDHFDRLEGYDNVAFLLIFTSKRATRESL